MLHYFLPLLQNTARLSLWLVILTAIFIPLERIFAVQPRRIFREHFLPDLGLYFLNGLITATVLSVPLAMAVQFAYMIVPESFYAFVDDLPLWAKLIATFAVGEFGFYWAHRWCHESRVLWRFHRIHHQPTGLDWLVNTRAHPVDIVFTRLCGLVPIYMLGLARPGAGVENIGPLLLAVIGTFWSFFIHSNIRWHLGWLEHVISSPHFHHWHHNREHVVNRNFAPMLPFVDRIFGTLHLPAKAWPPSYGISEAGNADPAAQSNAPDRGPPIAADHR